MNDLTFPIRTKSEANQREHWAVKSKRVKEQRRIVNFVWLSRFVETRFRIEIPCTVLLTRVAPRALDSDNLVGSFKAIRDQIAQQLGADDRDPRVSWNYEQRKGKEYFVECQIETLGGK